MLRKRAEEQHTYDEKHPLSQPPERNDRRKNFDLSPLPPSSKAKQEAKDTNNKRKKERRKELTKRKENAVALSTERNRRK